MSVIKAEIRGAETQRKVGYSVLEDAKMDASERRLVEAGRQELAARKANSTFIIRALPALAVIVAVFLCITAYAGLK